MDSMTIALGCAAAQADAAAAPLLSVESLSVHYGSRHALDDVTLHVPAGRVVALVGPSGSGKSTLLGCFNRLVDLAAEVRIAGRVRVGDVDVTGAGADLRALRRRVGMLFQRPAPFPLSIRQNVALPLREHVTQNRAELRDRTEAALRLVGLWHEVEGRLDEPATSLSGGQQQRLCLARALALDPDVLLLDEPCSALDPHAAARIEDLVLELRGRHTIVLVTHALAQARRVADHVVLLWSDGGPGRLLESAPVATFFGAPADPVTAAYVAASRS